MEEETKLARLSKLEFKAGESNSRVCAFNYSTILFFRYQSKSDRAEEFQREYNQKPVL